MRTILFTIAPIIFFSSVSCKQDSGSELLWQKNEKSVQFQYDPFYTGEPKLLSDLIHENGQPCLISGEDPGFKIQICIQEEGISEFAKILFAWKEGILVSEFSSVLSDDSEYKLGTYPFSGIKKKLEGSKFALVGDRKFKSLSSSAVTWDREQFNLKNHFRTFSIFFLSNGKFVLVLSPMEEGEVYLGLTFEAPGLEKEIQDSIISKNQVGLETCDSSLPTITEIFGETNTSIGRWIEIYNPNTMPICEEGLELILLGSKVSIPKTTGFLSPYEARVYAEDSASFERISLMGIKWGDLKKVGKIDITRGDRAFEFSLPGTGYLFGETYYSWKGNSFSNCESNLKFCMDPGRNQIAGSKNEFSCDPGDFELEELNPNGLLHKSILREDWKYLDLIYRGQKICDPSSLKINWGKNLFPIRISKKISEGEILSIGNLPFLLGSPSYSLSIFKSVTTNDIVSLSDSNGKEKLLWDGIFRTSKGIPTRLVLQKTNGETVSVCFENGRSFLHSYVNAKLSSDFTQSALDFENPRTSVGRKFCSKKDVTAANIKFSEISWMGSYHGSDPISKDRFLEFTSGSENSPDSAYLEIVQGNGTATSILLPLEKEGLSLLSSGKSICFPKTEFWKDTAFSLPSSGSNTLKVYDPYTGELWDEVTYSSSGPGINDTRNKIRKSAYSKLESGARVWSASQYIGKPYRDPDCSLTDANPGTLE
ncbi:LIC11755 family lipoprotein [Leptospira neocaledonica]|uniref:Lamin tail domain-containing protein n=1 Tax=Leptospira neocaledonica TaxID=2023192 RepID=A0A2N0A3C2_9LEPT|nr:hypothetical protein [Leptospira neocaledonica]PJZ78836.1 hypothetical protein CH365_00985 [Leptospira neocaledonica]